MAEATSADEVHRWGVFEAEFGASGDHKNPVQDVTVEVRFTGPDGKTVTREAFWDGGRTWRVRFSPDAAGRWQWQTRSKKDKSLDRLTGAFKCVPYKGRNPLYQHGPVGVSDDRWHLAHADGTPFFWLADTAWNGALLSDGRGWETYLKDRAAKRFTAVQFVTTQWRAAYGDAQGRVAYTGKARIAVDPVFFQRLDDRVDAVSARGLVAAPVMFWAVHVNPQMSPGTSLPEDQLIVLGRYMVARWGSCHPIWMMGGDGDYRGRKADRWKRIGRAVFRAKGDCCVTMHPMGQTWVADEFRGEPWFAFNGYQSGHGDSDDSVRWLIRGPPAGQWAKEPHHPLINLEPNYEGHLGYQHRRVFDSRAVRRACYRSLLVAPTAGVTYGAHGIWPWQEKAGPALSHPHAGPVPPWREAMKWPGSACMKCLRDCFGVFEWWRLRPAPDMLAEQPGEGDPKRFIVAARSDCGRFAVVYAPQGGKITLRTDSLADPQAARWFNPRTGKWRRAPAPKTPTSTFTTPDKNDWVLWVGRESLSDACCPAARPLGYSLPG